MQLTKDELVRVAAERVGELGVSNHLYDKLRAEEPEFYEYARQLLIDELNLVNQAEIPVTHSVSQP